MLLTSSDFLNMYNRMSHINVERVLIIFEQKNLIFSRKYCVYKNVSQTFGKLLNMYLKYGNQAYKNIKCV